MDWKKRKRVRTMRKVLRAHGSPVPKKSGCDLVLLIVAALFGATIGLVILGAMAMRR